MKREPPPSRQESPDAAPAVAGEKLQKVLARTGLGSRREMERWIDDGRVKVNGKPARVGDRVGEKDRISVDDRPLDRTPARETRCILRR